MHTIPTHLPAELPATMAAWWRTGVAIRSLAERHRPLLEAHLLALPASDRYLRFGYVASDEHVRRYVERLDFSRDEVLGVFGEELQLLAMAHLAIAEGSGGRAPVAEFGVSVLPEARGRGWGTRLFERSVLHARNRGASEMLVYALSENAPMLRIARKAGARIERDGGEAQATLALPPADTTSRMEELVARQAGELQFQTQLHTRHWHQWLALLTRLRTPLQLTA